MKSPLSERLRYRPVEPADLDAFHRLVQESQAMLERRGAFHIPSLSVTFRRLHDTGRSGGWILIGLIPLVGAIILLVFLAQDSEPGTNRFGANPKAGPVGRSFQAGWAAPQVKR